jgi:signal transduction histidine kinase
MSDKLLKILLLENNLTSLSVLDIIAGKKEQLSSEFFSCKSLENALEYLESDNFDLIILDFNLLVDNKLDSLQTFINSYPSLPIIVLIDDNRDLIIEISHKNVQDYLIKTEINFPLLKHSIYFAIERKNGDLALKKAHHELEEFAYIVSHDLKQPLSTISCWTQMLYMRSFSQLDDKSQKYVTSILKGTQQMDQLIESLLQYSRIGTKKRDFNLTNCEEIIKQIIINLEAVISENQATITYDSLPTIRVDSEQWRQLLEHLIENGIQYHREIPPKIHVSAYLKDDREWVFSVRDNGIGIESESCHQIFKIFQRLHSQNDYPGNGLGLAMCDRIVKRHGGKIWVESTIGEGSTFYFTTLKDL